MKQKNQFGCGPIGVINVLKWTGLQLTYKEDYKTFADICGTDQEGTDRGNITRALKKFKKYLRFVYKKLITFKQVDEHIRAGNCVLYEYFFPENGEYDGHYELLLFEDGVYYVVNGMYPAPAKQVIEREEIKKRLRCKMYRDIGSPSGWFLYRK